MTTYLRTHTLQRDLERAGRFIRRNRANILTLALSLALLVLTRQAATAERTLRGIPTNVVGGEMLTPMLPCLVRVIWESVREVLA